MECCIVIPCYNEARRLAFDEIQALVSAGNHVLLVDDGSGDDTLKDIRAFASRHEQAVQTSQLTTNLGKSEAVRHGLNIALEQGYGIVGYLDADNSVPAAEMIRLVSELESRPDVDVILGARWLHLGVSIKRSAIRHYFGRAFATFASNLLDIPVYDTQCGAKVFRATAHLQAVLKTPFPSRWAFDVELIGRLLRASSEAPGYPVSRFREIPLEVWTEVSGSKLGLIDMLVTSYELIGIWQRLRRLDHPDDQH